MCNLWSLRGPASTTPVKELVASRFSHISSLFLITSARPNTTNIRWLGSQMLSTCLAFVQSVAASGPSFHGARRVERVTLEAYCNFLQSHPLHPMACHSLCFIVFIPHSCDCRVKMECMETKNAALWSWLSVIQLPPHRTRLRVNHKQMCAIRLCLGAAASAP